MSPRGRSRRAFARALAIPLPPLEQIAFWMTPTPFLSTPPAALPAAPPAAIPAPPVSAPPIAAPATVVAPDATVPAAPQSLAGQ